MELGKRNESSVSFWKKSRRTWGSRFALSRGKRSGDGEFVFSVLCSFLPAWPARRLVMHGWCRYVFVRTLLRINESTALVSHFAAKFSNNWFSYTMCKILGRIHFCHIGAFNPRPFTKFSQSLFLTNRRQVFTNSKSKNIFYSILFLLYFVPLL